MKRRISWNLSEYTLNMMPRPAVNSNGQQSEISSVWYCRTSSIEENGTAHEGTWIAERGGKLGKREMHAAEFCHSIMT